MEIFYKIKYFYDDPKFSDLRIVSGLDQHAVLCHSLVISSAVPGLKNIINEHSLTADEAINLVFPETEGAILEDIVTDIYNALVQVGTFINIPPANRHYSHRITTFSTFIQISSCFKIENVELGVIKPFESITLNYVIWVLRVNLNK